MQWSESGKQVNKNTKTEFQEESHAQILFGPSVFQCVLLSMHVLEPFRFSKQGLTTKLPVVYLSEFCL